MFLILVLASSAFGATEDRVIETQALARFSMPDKYCAIVGDNKKEVVFYWTDKTVFVKDNEPVSDRAFFSSSNAPQGMRFLFLYQQKSGKNIITQARIEPIVVI